MLLDDETRDRDAQAKQKGKEYTDKRRHAKPSETVVGDTVWLKKMSRPNKLAPTFDPVPHTVVEKKGNELIVVNPATNARYRRNVSHAIKAPPTDPAVDCASSSSSSKPATTEPRPKRICRKPERYAV